MNKRLLSVGTALVLLAGAAAPAFGQKPTLAMLDGLQPGRWELRPHERDGRAERLCLRDGRRFIQLRHPAAACNRLVVDDTPTEVTVQYTCPGHGYGRTSIRRESGRLVQLESQGVVDGLPFSFSAEGRYLGECPD